MPASMATKIHNASRSFFLVCSISLKHTFLLLTEIYFPVQILVLLYEPYSDIAIGILSIFHSEFSVTSSIKEQKTAQIFDFQYIWMENKKFFAFYISIF